MNVHQLSQSTGEALMRAGWATGVVSDPDGFRVDWTADGLERLRLLYSLDLGALKLDIDQLALLFVWAALAGQERNWDQDAS